jgi:hypothetical protein
VSAPTGKEISELVQQIAARIGRVLERRGLVERDMENAWLATQGAEGPLDDLIGDSITYRVAMGPRAGQKLFALQTVRPEQRTRSSRAIIAAPPMPVASRCTPVWTSSRTSARSSNGCAAT